MTSEVEEWKNVTLRWVWKYEDVRFRHALRFQQSKEKMCGRRVMGIKLFDFTNFF